jgi:hypothetical protein
VALDAAHALVDFRIKHAVAGSGGMIFHDGAIQGRDAVAEALFHVDHIGGDVGAERVNLGAQLGEVVLRSHLGAHLRHFGPHFLHLRAHLA